MGIELAKAFVTVSANSKPLMADLKGLKTSVANEVRGIGIAATAVMSGFSLLGFGFLKSGLLLVGQLEQTKISFETMLGSADRAKTLLKDLVDFAAKTPFQLPGILGATKTLLAFGFTVEELPKIMKSLGDIAAGTGKDFKALAVIFGRIAQNKFIQGEEFNQLVDAGFPVIEIANTMGLSMQELRKEMSKGNVSFDAVAETFERLTQEGGIFFNLMDKQSKSLLGIQSTLSDNVNALKRSFAAGLAPAMKDVTNLMLGFVQSMNSVVTASGPFAGQMFAGAVAAGALTV